MKKKVPFGKKVKRVKRIARAAKAGNTFYQKVLPWILVAGAAAASFFLDVPVPERKKREKYKETW